MSRIAIVDYGVGNLKSVSNAFAYLGEKTLITSDPKELERVYEIGRTTGEEMLGSVTAFLK